MGNYRCQDWQDSVDSQCTVCEDAKHSQPRDHADREPQPQHHSEQHHHSEQWRRRENHGPHHHNNIKRDGHSGQTWSVYDGNLVWGCFVTALFVFGTQCFFWFLCFVATSIMSAMAFITSWRCSSACSRPMPFTTVYAYDDNAALQAALAASLLSSTPLEQQQRHEQQQQQQQQQQSGRAARCAGGGDGCC